LATHNDRHLTTEQLSALIDKQLLAEEQAMCDAHLQTCQQCQHTLADLQQTVALLHALPQPALPRSFTLPEGVTYLQERPERQGRPATTGSRRQQLWQYYVRRSLRAASMIAAVIGVVFLLSSVLTALLPYMTANRPTVGTANAPASKQAPTIEPNAAPASNAATATAAKLKTADHGQSGSTATTPTPLPRPTTPTSRVRTPNSGTTTGSSPPLPLPDLSTSLGKQEVGFTLLLLGILGVFLTRRKHN
jgi:hypothetical protein